MECSVIGISHMLGKKWSIALLSDIRTKKFGGFYDFTKKTGVTSRVLSRQLKELEKAGLIESGRGKGKYLITEKGEGLCRVIDGIKEWGIKWEKIPRDCMERSCSECRLFLGKKTASKN